MESVELTEKKQDKLRFYGYAVASACAFFLGGVQDPDA
jgi:hypothetical protein